MLGLGNTRINELEAENRTLRGELLAQTLRAEALAKIIQTLQRENESLTRHAANLAISTQHATTQAAAGHGFVPGDGPMDRLCWN